ncbi:MAG: hypothetical protein OET79_07215, partial [Nitrospirota bacterium]|nr:hypothetical protein [Nitrospirota bacterium]
MQTLRFRDPGFGLGKIRWGNGSLGLQTHTCQAMRSVCQASAREGYFCHDEMFVWAHHMIDNVPEITQ